MTNQALRPERQIRRFDIFAEWNRLRARERMKLPEADARLYGLAVAKVVAGRGGGPAPQGAHSKEHATSLKSRARQDDASDQWWRDFGTDIEYEDKIIHRMGERFYKQVFQPAIRAAWDDGQQYEDIRDSLRGAWNDGLKRR